ncbi:MAG: T9SS type A sorting domain-containing protein, partial [Rhodothermales bacterium]|nr:T9SS type A sorting domain-containing protein [Rhodothermales bacterium]
PATLLYPSVGAQIASTGETTTGGSDGASSADAPISARTDIEPIRATSDAISADKAESAGTRGLKPLSQRRAGQSDSRIPQWHLDRDKYAHSMTVTATVQIDGAESSGRQLFVAAFIDGQVRGVARTRRVGDGERELAFLMVYSDKPKGGPVTFRIYDAGDERSFDANEDLTFTADAIHGSPVAPQVLTVGAVPSKTTTTEELPTEFALMQNYPNPFNPVTTIRYELPKASNVKITLFDVLGREVRRLLDADRKAGRYDLVVDATTLASGMYVYRIEAGDFRDLRKMMVVK